MTCTTKKGVGEVLHQKSPPVQHGVLDKCKKGVPSTKIRQCIAALLVNMCAMSGMYVWVFGKSQYWFAPDGGHHNFITITDCNTIWGTSVTTYLAGMPLQQVQQEYNQKKKMFFVNAFFLIENTWSVNPISWIEILEMRWNYPPTDRGEKRDYPHAIGFRRY